MPKREEIVWCVVRTHATQPLLLPNRLTFPVQCRPFHGTYVDLQLFHHVVSWRQSHNADDLAPTNEDLMDERNDKNKKLMPKKGTGPGLHSPAGFSDVHNPNASLLCVILTGVIHAIRRGRLFCEIALFRRVYRVVKISLASIFTIYIQTFWTWTMLFY